MRYCCNDHIRSYSSLFNPQIFFEHAYLCNCGNTTNIFWLVSNIITAECVVLLLHFQEVPGLNLVSQTHCPDWVFLVLFINPSMQIVCQCLYLHHVPPSTSFPIYHSLITLPFNTIQYDTLTASLTLWRLISGIRIRQFDIQNAEHQVQMMAI
jgi:hypothetical protein